MLVQPALAGRAIDIDYGVDYVRLNVMTDSDGDGVADVSDACPLDPAKTAPGQCGCGTADIDSDSDGTADCNDGCADDPAKTDPGACGCGAADTDSDSDGTPDCNEVCVDDPAKFFKTPCRTRPESSVIPIPEGVRPAQALSAAFFFPPGIHPWSSGNR